ncbi:hypothetical protein [Shinella sp. M31]|uniref:hypothetical protein n=1 Tax=Shinella sp. M31 TaxID=3368615 RepID=UPI003BA153F9
MFVLVETLTTWWPVKVYEPDPERPGKFVAQEFEVEFEILDDDAVKAQREARAAVLEAASADTSENGLAQTQQKLDELDRHYFLRIVRNWRQVVDEGKKPVVFTEQIFLQALKRAHIREAIVHAYNEAIDTGKARLKN